MKILILNGSPRKKGLLAGILHQMEQDIPAEHETEFIDMYDLHIRHCVACMKCRETGVCCLPEDDAHRIGEKINRSDALIVGTPTYWGNMNSMLKTLFDRIVAILMREDAKAFPSGLQKGKKAIIVATCNTPYPFNILFKQSRGAVNSLREILKWSGFKIVATIERGGTRKNSIISPRLERKIKRIAHSLQ